MEKITKEELLEELKLNGLSDENLAKIAGGEDSASYICFNKCKQIKSEEFCRKFCYE